MRKCANVHDISERFRISLENLFVANACKKKLAKSKDQKRVICEDVFESCMVLTCGKHVVARSGDACEITRGGDGVVWCVDIELGDESREFPLLEWEYAACIEKDDLNV